MKITLFRDMPAEGWPSMERYADRLGEHLPLVAPYDSIYTYVFRLPWHGRGRSGTLLNQLCRSILYPLAASRHQSDINHIIDHSYAHLVHFLAGGRTVVTCHDLAPRALRVRTGISTALWDWSFQGMLKAVHIICDSEFTAGELKRFSAYPESRVSVVPLGVDTIFRPLDTSRTLSALRARYALPNDRPLLLHVGHCGTRKNLEGLITALGCLRSRGEAFHFVQIGGQFTPAQHGMIGQNDIGKHVSQISFVPEPELPAWYNLADVFVFPSTYEGFGLPILEAMACGTPVVCSPAGSLPEVGGSAVMYTQGTDSHSICDALYTLLRSDSLRQQLAVSGLSQAAKFSWQATARATASIYERCA